MIDLSQCFHYALNYVSMLFKKKIGTGFQEYLLDCRMQRAKHFLLDPALCIADIEQQVGYTNPRAFSSVFRKVCGFPPTEYREMRGREIALFKEDFNTIIFCLVRLRFLRRDPNGGEAALLHGRWEETSSCLPAMQRRSLASVGLSG